MHSILLIEDESAIADTVIYALRTEGYAVTHCLLGRDGLAALERERYALVILDVGLPDGNGFDLCRELRRFTDVPVIILTARNSEIDRIVGLEIGADDYVAKPFSPRELTARVRVILRRAGPRAELAATDTAGSEARCFRLSTEDGRIFYNGTLLDLTRYEYLLLKTMIPHPERIFTRADLMQQAWVAPDHSMERTVDTHVKTLRAKLKAIDPTRDPIETHRGLGYSLRRPR